MSSAEQIDTEIVRRLTPAQKLAVMQELWQQAWDLKAAGLRAQHPDWTEQQVQACVREIFGGAAADQVRPFSNE